MSYADEVSIYFAAFRCITSYNKLLKSDRVKEVKKIGKHTLVSTYVTVNNMGVEPKPIPTDIRNTFPAISITYPANVQQWKNEWSWWFQWAVFYQLW